MNNCICWSQDSGLMGCWGCREQMLRTGLSQKMWVPGLGFPPMTWGTFLPSSGSDFFIHKMKYLINICGPKHFKHNDSSKFLLK